MRNSRWRSSAVVMAVLAASAASAQPVPGAADLRFGVGGQVQTADPVWRATVAGAVAVDRLGRIVVGEDAWTDTNL